VESISISDVDSIDSIPESPHYCTKINSTSFRRYQHLRCEDYFVTRQRDQKHRLCVFHPELAHGVGARPCQTSHEWIAPCPRSNANSEIKLPANANSEMELPANYLLGGEAARTIDGGGVSSPTNQSRSSAAAVPPSVAPLLSLQSKPTADAGAFPLPVLFLCVLLGSTMGSVTYSIYLRFKGAPPEPAEDEYGYVEQGAPAEPTVTSPSRVAKMSARTGGKFEVLEQVDHEDDG